MRNESSWILFPWAPCQEASWELFPSASLDIFGPAVLRQEGRDKNLKPQGFAVSVVLKDLVCHLNPDSLSENPGWEEN